MFHTEDTGYCILRVQPDGQRDVVTVLGTAPRVVAGEQCEAEGAWQENAEYGRQFKAETLNLSRPDSLEGIERYLGSGLIDGIGEKCAKRLVAKFGKDVFDMIENYSARLEEVEGVGRKRRKEIRESWMKQKTVHNIMLFLHQHGITEFEVAPGTEVDVAMRHRISIIDSVPGKAKPKVIESYRPGFIYSAPDGREVILRKVEVKTSSQ